MEKFIPYEKLSKKKQREQNARRRGMWDLNPVTRKPENPKAYNRRKAHKWNSDDPLVCFYCLHFVLFGGHNARLLLFSQALLYIKIAMTVNMIACRSHCRRGEGSYPSAHQ